MTSEVMDNRFRFSDTATARMIVEIAEETG
jgi:hypothetical protein